MPCADMYAAVFLVAPSVVRHHKHCAKYAVGEAARRPQLRVCRHFLSLVSIQRKSRNTIQYNTIKFSVKNANGTAVTLQPAMRKR